jgi:hypothetical protein
MTIQRMEHVRVVVGDLGPEGVLRRRRSRFKCLICVRDSMDCAALGAVFPGRYRFAI